MKLETINDPRAMRLLNSMSIELGALETATVRIRAQVEMLFELFATVPAEACEAFEGGMAQAGGTAAEVGSTVVADEASGGGQSIEAANVEAPYSDTDSSDAGSSGAGVIVLCAHIEASVAEFAAAAEDASERSDADSNAETHVGVAANAVEERLDLAQVTAGEVSDAPTEIENEVAGEAAGIVANQEVAADDVPQAIAQTEVEGEIGSEAVASIDKADAQSSAVIPEAVGEAHSAPEASDIDAAPLPTAASASAAESAQEDAAVVVAEDPPATGNVVQLKLKRRVWPQRLAACASVLLIAAAGVVVAMPELVWMHI